MHGTLGYFAVSLHEAHGMQVVPTVQVTAQDTGVDALDLADLLKRARKINPNIGPKGVIQCIIRAGVQAVLSDLGKGKYDAYLRSRGV